MQRMREVIHGSLARSLRLLTEEDRLTAALPVVCESMLAGHCEVQLLDGDGRLLVRVDHPEWMSSLLGMRETLQQDWQRAAGVPLAGYTFFKWAPRQLSRCRASPTPCAVIARTSAVSPSSHLNP